VVNILITFFIYWQRILDWETGLSHLPLADYCYLDYWLIGKIMNLDRYTQKSQEAILESKSLAQELHHQSIEPAHLLMALLKQEDGVVPAIVNKLAGSVLGLREEVHQELENRSKVYAGKPLKGLRCWW
jgi:hypothetical protein